MIEINGVAHIVLTVRRFELCKPFYQRLLPFLGLKEVSAGNEHLYYVGGRTAVGVGACAPQYREETFDQKRAGLHHFCLRARSREDVDEVHAFIKGMGAKVVHPPEAGPWAPDYYSVLFEDPDGLRIEINFVPGKGVLAENVSFNPAGDYR